MEGGLAFPPPARPTNVDDAERLHGPQPDRSFSVRIGTSPRCGAGPGCLSAPLVWNAPPPQQQRPVAAASASRALQVWQRNRLFIHSCPGAEIAVRALCRGAERPHAAEGLGPPARRFAVSERRRFSTRSGTGWVRRQGGPGQFSAPCSQGATWTRLEQGCGRGGAALQETCMAVHALVPLHAPLQNRLAFRGSSPLQRSRWRLGSRWRRRRT